MGINVRIIITLAAVLLLSVCVSAVPNPAASAYTGGNYTLFGTGGSGTVGWFLWGVTNPGSSWAHTPNVSISAGNFQYNQLGVPVYPGTKYYFRACDVTGCSVEASFTTPLTTPVPQVFDGDIGTNMTQNKLNPLNLLWNSARPYTSVTGDTAFYGAVLMMILVGMWIRTRGTQTATTLGMLSAALFVSSTVGLGLGLPPEFVAAGQAIMYVSLAGSVVMFSFK